MLDEVLLIELKVRPVLWNGQALADYLHLVMAHRTVECVRVLFLNVRNVLIRDEQVAEGSVTQAPFYIRQIAIRAIELGSVNLILVHNHPSGDPTPSRQDIAMTRELACALKPLDIRLHDHIIVSSGGRVSMRERGYL